MNCRHFEMQAEELGTKIESIFKQPTTVGNVSLSKNYKETFEVQYLLLSVTDQKARGLLTINALTLAIIALFWKTLLSTSTSHALLIILPLVCSILLASSLLCMCAIRIDWFFYRHVKIENGNLDCNTEIACLNRVIVRRYYFYMVAWLFSFCLLIAFLLAFVFLFIKQIK